MNNVIELSQFRISDMKTARPRMASPRIVGILTKKIIPMNELLQSEKQRKKE